MRGGLAVALGLIIGSMGCTPEQLTENTSNVLIKIQKIVGTTGTSGDFINSDVWKTTGGVFNDDAKVTVQNITKNPNITSNAGIFDSYIYLQQYQVRYFRTDNQNIEGVDVPYTVRGPLSGVVPPNATYDTTIEIVRHQAKFEPPLKNLRIISASEVHPLSSGLTIFSCVAEVTVYGKTAFGDVVSATGMIQINFADFGDD